MAIDRRVTHSRKNSDGDITHIANPSSWGTVSKADAIKHIDGNDYRYFVNEAGYESDVHVYTQNGVKHIKTYADATSKNNLDNLPDC